MDYPIWDVTIGGGMLMALVAIPHVIVSHFAIGGGLLIAWTETLAVRRSDPHLRDLAKRGSLALILISTVFGAISGVGIWFVAGLISPGAISALIHHYVWGWAIEWTFFLVEIIAALIYYMTWDRVSKRVHVLVGWIYFVAAYLSLVVINGIVAFMLTPGRWLETGAFWDGFFNPTYWPALVLRSGICVMMAVAFLLFLLRNSDEAERGRLARYLGAWMLAGSVIAYAGYRWWEVSLPEPVLALFRGESPLLPSLASTRSLALWALTVALVVGGVLLVVIPRAARTATIAVVAIAAFAFFGGYERLREGARKPFLIHSHLFSNGLAIDDIEAINDRGIAARSLWPALFCGTPEGAGREIFLVQCASCHTLDGYQAIRPLLPTRAKMVALSANDPPGSGEVAFRDGCVRCHDDYTYADMQEMVPTLDDIRDDPAFVDEMNQMMIAGTLEQLRDMGAFYVAADRTRVIDPRETTHPHMPPLVGSDQELEVLAAYLVSLEEPEVRDAN